MTIITPDENGVSDCNCNGDHWVLAYFTDAKELLCVKNEKCRVTGKDLTIEYFATENEMNARINELDIMMPEDE